MDQDPPPTPENTNLPAPDVQPKIFEFADHGDLILESGRQEEGLFQIRVSSHVLRAASKTFDAMFGPNFSEGQDLNPLKPKKIQLEDDDPKALILICQVIHFRNNIVDLALSTDAVLKAAIAIDKYSLNEALAYAVERWLDPESYEERHDLSNLLKAAVVLRHRSSFRKVTSKMLLNIYGPYIQVELMNDETDKVVLQSIYFLEKKRNDIRITILKALHEVCEESSLEKVFYPCACFRRNQPGARNLDVNDYFSPRQLSDRQLSVTFARLIEHVEYENVRIRSDCREYKAHANAVLLRNYLANKVRTIKEELPLCLICVTQANLQATACKLPEHK